MVDSGTAIRVLRAGQNDALDAVAIASSVSPSTSQLLRGIEVLEETDSTNDVLLRRSASELHGRAVLAERQTAGKGQRGRNWRSPGGNIFLSLGWRFETAPHDLPALSLVVGICVCRALAEIGVTGHRVKHPNDILVNGAKLCGILVESRGGRKQRDTVTGIGVNVRLDRAAEAAIDQPCTDLRRLVGDELPSRNAVVAKILDELLPRFQDESGMAGFLADAWPEWKMAGPKS